LHKHLHPLLKLRAIPKQEENIKSIAFTPDGGWVIFYNKNGYAINGIPQNATNHIVTVANSGYRLTKIAFTPSKGWALLYDAISPSDELLLAQYEMSLKMGQLGMMNALLSRRLGGL